MFQICHIHFHVLLIVLKSINMILLQLKFLFLFSEECDDQSFGEECRKECGSCYDDTSCDHITGECPGECKDGWVGNFCNKSEQIKKTLP